MHGVVLPSGQPLPDAQLQEPVHGEWRPGAVEIEFSGERDRVKPSQPGIDLLRFSERQDR